MSNKDAAVFYLEALKHDLHQAANYHFFNQEYVSYRDLSVREAQLATALALVRNEFVQVPIDEPSDAELHELSRDVA